MILQRKGGEIFGYIHPFTGHDVYEIASLAPGKNLLIKYDTSNIYGAPPYTDTSDGTEQRILSTSKASGNCNTKIRVLVLYTDAAAKEVTNINNVINMSQTFINGAISNSALSSNDIRFELYGPVYMPGFTEGIDARATLSYLELSPLAASMRNVYSGDVAVLLTKDQQTYTRDKCWARQSATINNPYAVVSAVHANDHYAFTNAVARIVGCNNQQYNINNYEPNNDPGYAHGYKVARCCRQYITIMHVNVQERENMFSTPSVQIRKRDVGDPYDNFNARVLYENACDVAAFRPDDPLFMNVSMVAPFCRIVPAPFTVSVNIVNGIAPYTYQWYAGVDPFNQFLVSTSPTASLSLPTGAKLYVTVLVKDAAGAPSWDYRVIHQCSDAAYTTLMNTNDEVTYLPHRMINTGGPINENSVNTADKLEVFPNPANESITVAVSLSTKQSQQGASIAIINAYGQIVMGDVLTAAETSTPINTSRFASGIYSVVLKTGNSTTTKIISIHH